MITITLHSYPENGLTTHFSINECQQGSNIHSCTWEREVKDHLGFGFQMTKERSEVTTEAMVMELMCHENATTSFMLRALGWDEAAIDKLWDSYREAGV